MLLNLVKYLIICVSVESFSGNIPSSASTGLFMVLPCTPSICWSTLSCGFSKESLKIGDESFKLYSWIPLGRTLDNSDFHQVGPIFNSPWTFLPCSSQKASLKSYPG